ncbi:UDP-N-acetylglucosamine--dolichyl-phosphate N-acetylglucosaminephosphotransferase, putative [Plasmodium malariae]|uniref:UDP-N-acetylglucosamine--dolichyl-phosphate N-acetylglucosaminephosphotransferase n=1 Tax=Plasmodium malariae TaxID=5858 RepID=A0A1D3PAY3_PLAMA|nr:UDP-N-acetylglucosamine--dolichyl-phosphate N-acetylglucosaminephosphotransferase, putative [Plasmodium malariae]SCN12224.1 UDP-N-acetylglucosamine--dolichyl-phosphate N-acetylglucosaminephosphotransferase, putative [Plasmodium malariae]
MRNPYTIHTKHNEQFVYKENISERLLSVFLIIYLLVVLYVLKDLPYKKIILFYILSCLFLFKVTFICLPKFIRFLNEKGLYGVDLNKISKDKVAEPIGLFPSILYFIFVLIYQLIYYNDHKILLEYNAGLLSIIFMTFLGFIDDVLELKWRYKVILPFFASLPLLLSYSGETNIRIPSFLNFIFKERIINIGFFYYLYIILLSVFCTNAINIYAGINGLEIGQSLIISFFISIHNLTEIILNVGNPQIEGGLILKQHFLSIIFTLPFISINLATFAFNFYPSKGFVGNTLTYFCGIFLAVVSIFGHYSKTLILFLIPQFLNFFLSLPQLYNIVPCPRHRLPVINTKTNKLNYSHNYTLINMILYLFGPLSEYHLVIFLLSFQFITCSVGLFLRYFIDTT